MNNLNHKGIRSLLFLIFLSLWQQTYTQVPDYGSCPKNVNTVENFDVEKFTGIWYEYSKYPFIFEFGGKCVVAEYQLNANEEATVSVYNRQINTITNMKQDIKGYAKVVGDGKLRVYFPGMPSFLGGADYWVLGTDYTNYAVVYSCTDIFGLFHTKVIWILTRAREPTPETIAKAEQIILKNGFSLTPLTKTDQQNCPETF